MNAPGMARELASCQTYNFVNPSTPPICLAACLSYNLCDRVNRRTAATRPRFQESRVHSWNPTNPPNPTLPHLGQVAQVDGEGARRPKSLSNNNLQSRAGRLEDTWTTLSHRVRLRNIRKNSGIRLPK